MGRHFSDAPTITPSEYREIDGLLTCASQTVRVRIRSVDAPPNVRSDRQRFGRLHNHLGKTMKRVLLVLPFVLAACASDVIAPKESFVKARTSMSARSEPATCESIKKIAGVWKKVTVARGFDEFGYNRCARIFIGLRGGDHLKMKWNAEWDRGNLENWANPPYDALLDNEWNGQLPGGSGDVWHYKIRWVGSCGADSAPTEDGGYCIWGQFEVFFSHGTSANEHFWETHVTPAGFGN